MWIIYYLNTQTKGIYINFEAARSSKEGGREGLAKFLS